MITYEKLMSKVTDKGTICGNCYVFHQSKIQDHNLNSCYLFHLKWSGTTSEDNNASSVPYEWTFH